MEGQVHVGMIDDKIQCYDVQTAALYFFHHFAPFLRRNYDARTIGKF